MNCEDKKEPSLIIQAGRGLLPATPSRIAFLVMLMLSCRDLYRRGYLCRLNRIILLTTMTIQRPGYRRAAIFFHL
jgi:hypothetical protein